MFASDVQTATLFHAWKDHWPSEELVDLSTPSEPVIPGLLLAARQHCLRRWRDSHTGSSRDACANRWAVRGELGYISRITSKLLLELKAGAWFFANSDEFLGQKRQQAPIYALQHLF